MITSPGAVGINCSSNTIIVDSTGASSSYNAIPVWPAPVIVNIRAFGFVGDGTDGSQSAASILMPFLYTL